MTKGTNNDLQKTTWKTFPLLHSTARACPGVLDTQLSDKVCQSLATSQWFSPVTQASFTNKTYRHDITEILSKVALNTVFITLTFNRNEQIANET